MRYPKQIHYGQTIGLVAPSFGAACEPYASALTSAERVFENLGYKYIEYSCARRSDGFGISAPAEECGKEIEQAWCDSVSDALLSCGGGELMCETISHIDFDKIKNAPSKWFMGYSDNTNLVHLLVTLCDTAAIYGPCAPSFGMVDWHESITDAMDIMSHEGNDMDRVRVSSYDGWQLESTKDELHPLEPYNIDSKLDIRAYMFEKDGYKQKDKVAFGGRLIGGCVDCLSNLVGTKFDKTPEFVRSSDEGVVWMLECCELTPMDLRRSLWQMYMAGWFENTNGFIFGRPERFGEESFGKSFEEIVLDFFEQFNIHTPCIFDADFGHKPPMMPIIMGSVGACDFQHNVLSITMNLI